MGKSNNLAVMAITRGLGLAITLGLPIRIHTFMDGSQALVIDIGRKENGERNMLIIHRLVPSHDVVETERGQRLMRALLIAPEGRQPFWGELKFAPETAFFTLLAPSGSVVFHHRDAECVATGGETDTLDLYLIKLRQGPAGAVSFTVTGDGGRQVAHKVSFINGEFITEEVDSEAADEPEVDE